jgi:putative transposase
MAEIYHVLNRSMDKRKIFLDKQDYFRFIHDLFEFNDQKPVESSFYHFQKAQYNDLEGRYIREPRKLLVDIYAFCIMPNHYHLLLSPKIDNGISWFMQKLGAGYVKYFNKKYKRKGTIFEGRYKSILIDKQNHFYNLPYYIHLNPLDIEFPEWRDRKLKDYNKAIEFLSNYRWSSHLDYSGKNNFPSVTNREFLLDVFGGEEKYKDSINKWLKEMEIDRIRDFILE